MSAYQWISVLGVPSILSGLVGFIVLQVQQDKAIKLAVRAMLRDRLLNGYKHYITKGWADLDDRSNLENVYTQYKALKGNGDMKDLRQTFRHLPFTEGGPAAEVTED